MDTQHKKEEDLIKGLVQEAGLEKPSVDFLESVMKSIEVKSSATITYKPLVSNKGWWLIAAIFMISMVWLYLYPMAGASSLESILRPKVSEISNPFEGIQISKTMLYGIGCLALFLVQLPFLKRMINKQYS
ncbi:MAG: hypothetical protein K0U54_12975 [Bacteroidetes bacterium]|nr:hypothetical protein [Bacteroidota bacterium]